MEPKTGGNDLDTFWLNFDLRGEQFSTYFDDIQVDTSGVLNLSNPIPEPAVLALMLTGGSALLLRRRR